MRRAVGFITALACALAVSVECRAASEYFERLERESLPDVRPPEVKVVDLANGMRCFLLSDSTLPIVNVEVIVRSGAIFDPEDKVGLAALAAAHMRTGGAGDLSPADFDKRLDDLGAGLGISTSREMTVASLEVLSQDLEEGLKLLFDMLFKPQFDAKRLSTARKNMEEALRREDDSPDEKADRLFREMLYGKDSPWARRPDTGSLKRISAQDISDNHSRYFKPGNMIIAAAGDFSYARIEGLLKKLTQDAPTGEVTLPEVEPVALQFQKKREDVRKKTSQSFIRMGHLGVKRDNPDRFALTIVNDILGGGGFKSRLMDDIRVKRGMAYSVSSSMAPNKDYGQFVISLDTKADQTDEAIQLVEEHVQRIAVQGDFTKEELDFAKQSIISSLVFLFDQPSSVTGQRARYHFLGYPDDYWRVFRDAIMRTGLDDLKRVAKEYLHPDGMETVVVGPAGSKRDKEGKGR